MRYFDENHCDAPHLGVDVNTTSEERMALLVKSGYASMQGARRGGIAKGVPTRTKEEWQRRADELFAGRPEYSQSSVSKIIAREPVKASENQLDGRAFAVRTIRKYIGKKKS